MAEDFCDLTRLIRSLQRLEGRPECFATDRPFCEGIACLWREYCLEPEGVASERGPGKLPEPQPLNGDWLMEKRAFPRYLINTPIVCRHLNSPHFGEGVAGIMKNCCAHGLYAELAAPFKAGAVLVVRTTGSPGGYSREQGFQSLAIAEVKWSRPIAVTGEACHATGLKYVML